MIRDNDGQEKDCEDDYRGKIIEMVEKINNQGTLKYLYTFIKLFLEKWG